MLLLSSWSVQAHCGALQMQPADHEVLIVRSLCARYGSVGQGNDVPHHRRHEGQGRPRRVFAIRSHARSPGCGHPVQGGAHRPLFATGGICSRLAGVCSTAANQAARCAAAFSASSVAMPACGSAVQRWCQAAAPAGQLQAAESPELRECKQPVAAAPALHRKDNDDQACSSRA